MKESLGRALVLLYFYPSPEAPPKTDGLLEIDCSRHGILFVEAEAEGGRRFCSHHRAQAADSQG
uniref:Uncharacterized protein n=1 Tax=Nymphaea colorata TaxID=210225 RepID=A0A5K1C3V8_9MAGN